RAVAGAAQQDWIVFTSPNGVRVFFETFARQERDVRELARLRLAAIGPETAAELGRRQLRADTVPTEYRAEGLIEALAGEDLRGRRFLLPRAAGARAVLPQALTARGARVEEVVAYEAVLPRDADVAGLGAALAARAVDAIAFTSSSKVRNFVTLLGGGEGRRLGCGGRPADARIGPVNAET